MAIYPCLELEGFDGFYKIPGYSMYGISKDGIVINIKNGKRLLGSKNPAGYYNFRLTDNSGYTLTFGRHRLLCLVFKRPIDMKVNNLIVNHINGIKGDDRLENLEWVTHRQNVEHAGRLKLTDKCLPVEIRDIDSGCIYKFNSCTECAKFLNITKDAVLYRVKSNGYRIFPDRKQYRLLSELDWPIIDNVTNVLAINGTSKSVLVRNVKTGNIKKFDKLSDLAEYLKVSPSTITSWLNKPNQPVLPGFIQLKYETDSTLWRTVSDPESELRSFSRSKEVIAKSESDASEKIFKSAAKCARFFNIKTSTMNYILNKTPHVYKNGYRFEYTI